ncbi:MAG: DNA-processing protein DprA [Rhodobacteraceae bacterium]|nr:DNA-processing protein DprA [Paracoccaceae bacterium]
MSNQTIPPSAIPTTDIQRIDWMRLIRSRRVGPATFYRLLGECGSAQAALATLPQVARDAGVTDYETCAATYAAAELAQGQSKGYHLLCISDPEYPSLLKKIPDAPPILWVVGDLSLLSRPSVSLVGARNASSLGVRMTRLIAHELGEAGYVVTSGLARGIDAAAHEAALKTGTIAVQASGLDVIYPRENARLHDDIAQSGLRLSEQPIGLPPQARHFPQRNRIIAGLSTATVVIEGAARSGSLITARDTADLGRDVMAVPGNPLDARAAGCNMLIRDGAMLVRSGKDIIDALQMPELPPLKAPNPKPVVVPPEHVAEKILTLLGPNAIPEDMLIRDTGLPAQSVSQHLLSLELEGKIERHPGGMLALAS